MTRLAASLLVGSFFEGAVASLSQSLTMAQASAVFQEYQKETNHWVIGTGPDKTPKEHLETAMSMANVFSKWLVDQDEPPEGLNELNFAWNVLEYARDEEQVNIAMPLLMKGFEKENKVCVGNPEVHTGMFCQNLAQIMCSRLDEMQLNEQAAQCIAEYNKPRQKSRHFATAKRTNRQLPDVRVQPFWPKATEEPSLAVLSLISSRFTEIRDEVVAVMNNSEYASATNLLDFRYGLNDEWDPKTAWTGVRLYAGGVLENSFDEEGNKVVKELGWQEDTCQLFPVTCNILKSYEDLLLPLFPSKERYSGLIGKERAAQGYDKETPSVGIAIYKVSSKAGIKKHCGLSGRLVHSIPLSTPVNPPSTLSVGGETQPWVEGQFLSFDDSFVHEVHNPHPTDARIVLSIVALHPDLANEVMTTKQVLALAEQVTESPIEAVPAGRTKEEL